MTEQKDPAARWHPTEVVLRADIYRMACEKGIDVGDTCNRALADALGIDYRQKVQEPVLLSSVIIARDGGSAGQPAPSPVPPAAKDLHPVINADDPSASTKVKLAKQHQAAKVPQPAPAPVRRPGAKDGTPVPAAPKKGTAARQGKGPTGKRSLHEVLKTFFSSRISREADQGAGVSKDEMYETFARWCREHRILPVPDRRSLTVALKNQFALQETVIGGVPSWTGINLK
jgi:hypothetical protein